MFGGQEGLFALILFIRKVRKGGLTNAACAWYTRSEPMRRLCITKGVDSIFPILFPLRTVDVRGLDRMRRGVPQRTFFISSVTIFRATNNYFPRPAFVRKGETPNPRLRNSCEKRDGPPNLGLHGMISGRINTIPPHIIIREQEGLIMPIIYTVPEMMQPPKTDLLEMIRLFAPENDAATGNRFARNDTAFCARR